MIVIPDDNTVIGWRLGEPKSPTYDGFTFVNSRRLPQDVIDEAHCAGNRVWWSVFMRSFAQNTLHHIADVFEVTPKELGLEGPMPTVEPMPDGPLDLLALAAEVVDISDRMHEMYETLRTKGWPFSWALAVQVRDMLGDLADQLMEDAAEAAKKAAKTTPEWPVVDNADTYATVFDETLTIEESDEH